MRSLKPRALCTDCGISAPITRKHPPHLCMSCRRKRRTEDLPVDVDAWLISGSPESLTAYAEKEPVLPKYEAALAEGLEHHKRMAMERHEFDPYYGYRVGLKGLEPAGPEDYP